MINIFISYCKKDEKYAKLCQKVISNRENPEIKCNLVPFETTEVERNAEKISRFIDFSDIFLVLYTEKARNSIWVNQEVGYAFNYMKQKSLKIIILYEKRKDIEGFIYSREYNISKEFKLKGDYTSTFNNVKKNIIDEYKFPIDFQIAIGTPTYQQIDFINNNGIDEEKIDINLSIIIENLSGKIIKNSSIHIVYPDKIEIDPRTYFPSKKIKNEKFYNVSKIIPLKYLDSFNLECKAYKRLTIPLDYIDGFDAKENFITVRFNKKCKDFNIGLYFQAPLIGSKSYELKIKKYGEEFDYHESTKIRIWKSIDSN